MQNLSGAGSAILDPALSPAVVAEPPTESEGLDLVGILSTVDETAYVWDLVSDRLDWESNAREVLKLGAMARVNTGASYNLLIAPEHLARRDSAFTAGEVGEGARGVSYRLQYRLQPDTRCGGGGSLWIEDRGRWWADEQGRPRLARGIVRVLSDTVLEEQRMLLRTDYDELTGQLNRIRLTDAIGVVLARGQRLNVSSAFLMVAVNNLAVINETFGFDTGDEVIASTARVIKSKLRSGDTLGRYSSNKFGIILNDCGPGAMRVAAERFMKAVRDAPIRTSACQVQATLSIGGVLLPDQASNVQHVVGRALHALDRAKQKRFDCFMPYEPSPSRETTRQRNIAIADEVMAALEQHRMRLVLQPMIGAVSRRPELYECLLRMEREDGSQIAAGEFIPVAEQLGLSRLIDRRTMELAVALLEQRPELKLSLNVSGLTCTDHDWLVGLHRLTHGRRSITERLVVEITETVAIEDLDQTVAFVDTLKDLGCRVAIDDFGAGYTSFRNLRSLAVDMVKIDGAFVKHLAADASDQVFVRAMVDLARNFEMETVAEWVGDEETCRILTEAGITYLQGFHFGAPIEVSALP